MYEKSKSSIYFIGTNISTNTQYFCERVWWEYFLIIALLDMRKMYLTKYYIDIALYIKSSQFMFSDWFHFFLYYRIVLPYRSKCREKNCVMPSAVYLINFFYVYQLRKKTFTNVPYILQYFSQYFFNNLANEAIYIKKRIYNILKELSLLHLQKLCLRIETHYILAFCKDEANLILQVFCSFELRMIYLYDVNKER